MHRIDTDGAVLNLFSDGTPSVAPPTVVDAAWLNDMQENLAQAVEGSGLVLSKGDYTQLAKALRLFPGDTDETIAARKTVTVPTARRLIDQWNLGGTTNAYGRLYAGLGELEFTVNANWNGNWVPDDSSRSARILRLPISGARSQGGYYGDLSVSVKANTSVAWSNTGWDIDSNASGVIYGTNVNGSVDDLARAPDGGVRIAARFTFSAAITADTTIATLPSGCRPKQPVYPVGTAGTDATHFDGAFVRVKIDTDGTVKLGSATANVGSAGGSLAFCASFTGA